MRRNTILIILISLATSTLLSARQADPLSSLTLATELRQEKQADGSRNISLVRTTEELETWLDEVTANPEELAEGDFAVTYRTLLPAFVELDYTIENIRYTRSNEALPSQVGGALAEIIGQENEVVRITDQIIFREMYGTVVEVVPFMMEEGEWFAVTDLSFEAIPLTNPAIPFNSVPISPSFRSIYERFFDSDELDEIGYASPSGGYLLVGADNYLGVLDDWITWKRQNGFPVQQIETENGDNFDEVRTMISDAWNEAEIKPEYILLLGDPDRGQRMPGDFVDGGEHGPIITDHPYTLLEGEDYWPDIWVGRWSVRDANELNVIQAKSLAYEQGSNLVDNNDWLERGLVICDNTYSSTGLTSSWVRREMLEYGFAQVDSVWYPPTVNANQIISIINNGVGWVNYRGFGSSSAWINPVFTLFDVFALNNTWQTPIVTSIVCGGGIFNAQQDPCLGEAFLRTGSVNQPKGAVAFIGPSEVDTHTRWNNCNDMNIYIGLLHENISVIGPLMFRGKLGIWNGFPNNRDFGDPENSVLYYFAAYNLLGDPGLMVRTRPAVELALTHLDTLPIGSNDFAVQVTDMEGSIQPASLVSLSMDEWGPINRTTDESGYVRFDLTDENVPEGEMTVTASIHNSIPAQNTVVVASHDLAVGLVELEIVDGEPTPGSTILIEPVLENVGNAAQGEFTATLSSSEGGVEIIDDMVVYDALGNPGDGVNGEIFEISIDLESPDGWDPGLILTLNFTDNNLTRTVRLPFIVEASKLLPSQTLIQGGGPGEQTDFDLTLENMGSRGSDETTITISSVHPELQILQGSSQLNAIAAGDQATTEAQFSVEVSSFAIRGEKIPILWEVEYENGRVENGELLFLAGEADVTDPFGPDAYGYWAYDNLDTNYWSSPTYSWLEIAPELGGVGTALDLQDFGDEQDASIVMDLPFDVVFYGETHTQATICSNGWLAMNDHHEINFRNWNLLDGPGPMDMIAPFWDDLILNNGSVSYYHDEVLQRFIVEWSHANCLQFRGPNEEWSFQVILYSPDARPTPTGDSEIEFLYKRIGDIDTQQNFSTIGIKNHDGSQALEIRYAGNSPETVAPLGDMRAYRITTHTPPGGVAVRSRNIVTFDDGNFGSQGDGDGNIENGEIISLLPTLKNYGDVTATNLTLSVTTSDTLIELLDSEINFASIEPGQLVEADQQLRFQVGMTATDHHSIPLTFNFSTDEGWEWSETRSFDVYSFLIAYQLADFYDPEPGGNDNDKPEAGESIKMSMYLRNEGRGDLFPFDGDLITDDPYLTITQNESHSDGMESGRWDELTPPFEIDIHDDAPAFHNGRITFVATTEGRELYRRDITFVIGYTAFADDFEAGVLQWSQMTGQWHRSNVESHSPAHSLRWGDDFGETYGRNLFNIAASNPIEISSPSSLRLWANWDFGLGDYFTIIVRLIQEDRLYTLDSLSNRSGRWTMLDYEIPYNFDEEQVIIVVQASSDEFDQGFGIYLDDVIVYNSTVGVTDGEEQFVPVEYTLFTPHPNPFNPTTQVKVALPEASNLDLRVINLLGQEVAVLNNSKLNAGYHTFQWNAEDVPSGLYFIQMQTKYFRAVKKAMLVK
ncbi:T9SS type A sorting domain-containing protein [bacterium]|nr:T9SS type A sorting domain-containing protein [bacterium]